MLLYVHQPMSERHQSSPMPPSRHNPHHLLSPLISPSPNPEMNDSSSQNSPACPESESLEAERVPSPTKELFNGTEEPLDSQASDNFEGKNSYECENQQKRNKLFEFEQQFQDDQLHEFTANAATPSNSLWTFNAANQLVDPTSGKSYEIASELLEQQHSHPHAPATPEYSPLTTTTTISMTAQAPLLTSPLPPLYTLQQQQPQQPFYTSSRSPVSPSLPTPPPPVDITGDLSSTDPYQPIQPMPIPQSEASTSQSSPSSMHEYLRRSSLDWESMTQGEQDRINAHMNGGGGMMSGNRTEVSASNRKQSLYKTELCRSWEETGTCRYGRKCQYAHSEEELRPVIRHQKYKTVICKTYWETGSCPYGVRCCFIHRGETRANKKVILVDNKVSRGRRISSDSVESGDGDNSGGEPAPAPSIPTTAALEKEQGWVMYTGAGPSREHSPGAVLPPPTTGPLRFSRGIYPRSYQQQSPQPQQQLHQQPQQQDHLHYSVGANVPGMSQLRSSAAGRDLTIDTGIQDRFSSMSLRDSAGGSPREGPAYRHGTSTVPSATGSQEAFFQLFNGTTMQNSTGSSPAASYPSTPTIAPSYIDHRNVDHRAFADLYFGHGVPISAAAHANGVTAQRRASFQYSSLAHQTYPQQDPLHAVPEPTNTSMGNRQHPELFLPSGLFTEFSSPATSGISLTSATTSPIISSRRPRAQSEILYGPVPPQNYFPSSAAQDRSMSQTSTTGLTTILTSTYDEVRERMGTSMLGAGAVGSERGRRAKNMSEYSGMFTNSGRIDFGGDGEQDVDESASTDPTATNSGFSYIY